MSTCTDQRCMLSFLPVTDKLMPLRFYQMIAEGFRTLVASLTSLLSDVAHLRNVVREA